MFFSDEYNTEMVERSKTYCAQIIFNTIKDHTVMRKKPSNRFTTKDCAKNVSYRFRTEQKTFSFT